MLHKIEKILNKQKKWHLQIYGEDQIVVHY